MSREAHRFDMLKQVGAWALEVADPLVAVLAGLGLAIAGLAGWIEEDTLTATTLFVLSVVALSLLRERWLRVRANTKIDALAHQQEETTAAVNAIGSGNPYSVLLHETTWDIIESDGSQVSATRVKSIRFDQNRVFSFYDFSDGDGTKETEYLPGKAVDSFLAEGRMYTLVSLGRVYYRGEHLTLTAKRTITDGFKKDHEAVGVLVQDATERLRLIVKWPADRPPTAVRLGRATPARDWRNEDVLDKVETKDGRSTYEVEIENPERGSTTTIEWEWGSCAT